MISRNIDGLVQEEENMYSGLNKRISKTQKTTLIVAGTLGLALTAQQCSIQQYQQPTTPGYDILIDEPCIKPHNQHIDVTPCYQTNNDNS